MLIHSFFTVFQFAKINPITNKTLQPLDVADQKTFSQ